MGIFKQGCQVLIQGGGGIQGLQSKFQFLGTISENTRHQLSWINQDSDERKLIPLEIQSIHGKLMAMLLY